MSASEQSAIDRLEAEVQDLARRFQVLRDQLGSVLLGQQAVVESVVQAVAAGGHVLLEGAPGLGKTLLVRTLAESLALDHARVQFTPDLMPADITGTHVVEEKGRSLERRFQPGPVFTNVLLADEINRATPKTQSALLEAMQERTVTVAGEMIALPAPFFVLATQNPIDMEGTYPLPEAQLDRFLLKIDVPRLGREDLVSVLERTTGAPVGDVRPVMKAEELLELQARVKDVIVAREVHDYVARLVLATHPDDELAPDAVRRGVRFGSSPRGAQALILAAKARALSNAQVQVGFEDVDAVALPTLRHRIILGFQAEAEGISTDTLVREVLAAVRA